MFGVDLNQPVMVTFTIDPQPESIRFDTLRQAIHSVATDFIPDLAASAFICTKEGGLNIVEIRALYRAMSGLGPILVSPAA